MSCTYADGLSPYGNKGICGLPEVYDSSEQLEMKINHLARLISTASHVVVHTGAGISTSAGIPDFRGPKGVWTLEQKGEKPLTSVSFDSAVPTTTHMALVGLVQGGFVHHIVSQNVDGLHLKSGLPACRLSELHGNMFLDKCSKCKRQIIRRSAAESVGQKCGGKACPLLKAGKRSCRGQLHDTILDWEDELPLKELEKSELESRTSDLSICLGTTLQILPSGKLPLLCKANNGHLVICNLQPTKYDSHADLLIHNYVDCVMKKLMEKLGLKIPEYSPLSDPTRMSPHCEYVKPFSRKPLKRSGKVFKQNIPMQVLKDEEAPSTKAVKCEFVSEIISSSELQILGKNNSCLLKTEVPA